MNSTDFSTGHRRQNALNATTVSGRYPDEVRDNSGRPVDALVGRGAGRAEWNDTRTKTITWRPDNQGREVETS